MTYDELKLQTKPQPWWKVRDVTNDPDLEDDDRLTFHGAGDGTGTVSRKRGGVTEAWGKSCTYTSSPAAQVTGTHIATGRGFLILCGSAPLSGALSPKPPGHSNGGPTAAGGSWQAQEGG